jgi:DnaK suppressor protein
LQEAFFIIYNFIILNNEVYAMKVKLEKGYRPSEDEKYMNPKQIEYFRRKLIAWKEELLEEAQETMEHLKEENLNEPDVNDRATNEAETAFELRTRDRYRKLISKIDRSLEAMQNNEYGYCEETGDPIGVRRLEARPIANLCIEAQERHENYESQHSAE